ncbi:hypothetical protein PCANC_03833 [Puccinia coronata f. sp. avenae]|uniref:Uncharacterized protein n=1 Tax=Puccinia coronata f. sp. avenae TaxID=200324 RepID=A0A2N5T7A9_9BASI|nr:hypothetical protein PCANC_03833 [Puccinia coronata f. sp. avenae]
MTSMPEVAGRNDDRYFGAVTGGPELVVRPLSGWNAQGVYSELSESSRRRLLAAVNNLSPADHDAVVTSRGHWHCLPETNAERLPGSDCGQRPVPDRDQLPGALSGPRQQRHTALRARPGLHSPRARQI